MPHEQKVACHLVKHVIFASIDEDTLLVSLFVYLTECDEEDKLKVTVNIIKPANEVKKGISEDI